MTETTAAPTPAWDVVASRITRIQHGYLNDRSDSVAALARLRRAAGKEPGAVFDIFEHTLAEEFSHGWNREEVSYEEAAAHHAMTLYAVHQQSSRTGMHQPGARLGRSIRKLHTGDSIKPTDPIARRFTMLGTSGDFRELTHHLRGVVQLLRAARVPLDYGLLTRQLITWQHVGGPDRVRPIWGRDFHLAPAKPQPQTDSKQNTRD
ncbi:type I-E CRISPR-associated protein Cse2/CasB [Actinokineospora sp. NBRC 105648]|uniref:type I-E CRISPR-associated protein Cse2/CasB n=1 Tax=Actinokineospora sp. NBRC 105648 TaxID=3032206 RepID=UPI0024A3CF4A|nr:type I-E CRISPR-associated protein Cse2/CasB [Actinokineospora sp. NBRC 105648]GLZ38736.1 hypothetical protein Acsp05_23600 [Actinokineospora sp. NBRC 105648]